MAKRLNASNSMIGHTRICMRGPVYKTTMCFYKFALEPEKLSNFLKTKLLKLSTSVYFVVNGVCY